MRISAIAPLPLRVSAWTWVAVLVLWLLGGSPVSAGELLNRIAQFPDWQGKPPGQAAQGDLVYPDWFLGTWNVTTTLVDLVAPLAPEVTTPGFDSNRQFLQKPVPFQARFIQPPVVPRVGSSSPFPAFERRSPSLPVIADRAFNGMNLARAYLDAPNQKSPVLSVQIDPTNPNRQITQLRSGNRSSTQKRQLVSTVINRATETPSDDQFMTSEVFQQEFRGAPQVFFNTVETTTAYRRSPDPKSLTAEQITAVYLSPQDPDFFKAGDRPVALYRYRMEFSRAENVEENANS